MHIGTQRTRLVRHDSAQGTWSMAFCTPGPLLAPFVTQFNAYEEWGTAFARRRELPTGLATVLFNLGPELRIEHPADTRTAFAAGAGFFAGVHGRHAVSETDGAQRGAQVMLTPLGARLLAGIPLAELGDALAEPRHLFGAAAAALAGRLHDSRSQPEQLALLEHAVAQRIAAARPLPRDLAWACRRLRAGPVRIGNLAAAVGGSRTAFSGRFRREFGVSPKLLARLLRFDRALRLLRQGQARGWAEVAAACGYADQAHLTREFRAFAGAPPAAFCSRRLPDEGGFVD